MAKTPNTPAPGSDESAADPTRPQPTAQVPLEPEPVSASSSASGGETGLAAMSPRRESVFRRHPLATGITAGAIAVVLVSGLTAWGVGTAVAASLTSSTSAQMPMAAPTTAPNTGMGNMGTAGTVAFRATIQSMDSGTWTILTKKGKTVTLTVDSSTQFGTKRMTATAGSFAVGDNVVVVAERGANGDATATRIVEARGAAEQNAPAPSATPTPNA